MFSFFKKEPPTPFGGPDFSDVDSAAKAKARVQNGELEKLFLLPPEFGGTDDPRNIVYVPLGFTAIKSNIDLNIIKPLVADEKVTKYECVPEHVGKCFVPIAIKITASDPGSFTSDINIWGKALGRNKKT
jgi:hypothetical protein